MASALKVAVGPLFVATVVFVWQSLAGAQSSTRQRVYTSSAAGVVLDVVVRDAKGVPVHNLSKEDFAVFEDGVEQTVTDVASVVTNEGTPAKSGMAAATPPGTHTESVASTAAARLPHATALVFDRLTPEARDLACKAAVAFVDTLEPEDVVGVFISDLALRPVMEYTSDKPRLKKAIGRVGMAATSSFDRNSTRDRLAERDARGNPLPGDADPSVSPTASAESEGRPVDGRSVLEREIAAVMTRTQANWTVMARDQAGYATTDALLAVAAALGRLPGRKTVILFAEGLAIPPAVLPRFRDVIATANRANVSFYSVDAAGLKVHSDDAEMGREVRAMGQASLSGGASTMMLERNEEALRRNPRTGLTLLAKETGGFLLENTNDITTALRAINVDRRNYYLVSYSPRNTAFNGKWRSVVVKVRNPRLSVRSRSGYFAVPMTSSLPLLAYEAPALAALDQVPRPGDLPLSVGAFVFPGGSSNTVAVVAATDASAVRFAQEGTNDIFKSDFTIVARVRYSDGESIRNMSQHYTLAGPQGQIDRLRAGKVLFFKSTELGSGTYSADVAIHDALTSKASAIGVPFAVPDSKDRQLVLGTLVVVQQTEHVSSETAKNNPFVTQGVLVYPNLGEPIPRSRGALTWYQVGSSAHEQSWMARIQVLRGGALVLDTAIQLRTEGSSSRIAHLANVPLGELPAGSYVLRLIVDDRGLKESREAPFALID